MTNRLCGRHIAKRPVLGNRQSDELLQFISEGLANHEPFYAQAAYSVWGDIESEVQQIYDLVVF
jgi:hypothetical protein